MGIVQKGAPEEGRTGRYGDVIYYQSHGRTYFRSAPIYPKSRVMKTPVRQKQTMLFRMVQQHIREHLWLINLSFDHEGQSTPRHHYQHCNSKALYRALDALADRYLAEKCPIDIREVEQAICNYASAHPDEIFLANKQGFKPVMFTGVWPTSVVLEPIAKKPKNIVVEC